MSVVDPIVARNLVLFSLCRFIPRSNVVTSVMTIQVAREVR